MIILARNAPKVRGLALALVYFIVLLAVSMLAGCAPKEVLVATVVTPPKPVMPRECNPADRAAFPQVDKVPGNRTPVDNLGRAMIEAKAHDADNAVRERLCYDNIKPQFTPPG